jgi:hypothetical protein
MKGNEMYLPGRSLVKPPLLNSKDHVSFGISLKTRRISKNIIDAST